MRDLALMLTLAGSVLVAAFRPWIGIYLWYWIALMNPHRLTYGFMYQFPVALVVAVVTIAGAAMTSDRAPFPRQREAYLFLILAVAVTMSTVFAWFPDRAWVRWQEVMKILFMSLLTVILINSRAKLRHLLLVVVLSLGFYSVKGAIWGVATGAAYRLYGPSSSMVGDNNAMGLALNMMMPVASFFSRSETRRWVRLAFLGIFGASIFGVLLTYSRGGFLGLAVVLVALVLQRRKNFMSTILLAAAVGLVFVSMPTAWFERISTIGSYGQDESAMSRIDTWRFAWDVALKSPITGGGFQAFRANPSDYDAHSIYFGMLGEHGFLGLGVFLALIVATLLSLGRVIRLATRDPELAWYAQLAGAVRISVIAFMVSGAFLNLQYFELFYLLAAITMILVRQVNPGPAHPAPLEPGAALAQVG